MRRMVLSLALALMVSPILGAQTRWDLETGKTWKGIVVDHECYKKLGADKAMEPNQAACAAAGYKKGEIFGVFTDEDGYMQIVGNLTKNNNAAIVPLLGKRVAVTGNSQRDAFSGRYVDALKLIASK